MAETRAVEGMGGRGVGFLLTGGVGAGIIKMCYEVTVRPLRRRECALSDKKGAMMRKAIFGLILWVLVLLPCGCRSWEQPGETAAEGRRRHDRVARVNHQEMMSDIDKVLLLDKPSTLTDKRIP